MSLPLGALVSKSRRMTLSSCSKDSTVEKSSRGMMFEGSTSRPCRLRANAFMTVPSDRPGKRCRSVLRGALHPSLHGGDEARSQLGGGDDGVHRAHLAGPLDVVHCLELSSDLAQLLRPDGASQVGELHPEPR